MAPRAFGVAEVERPQPGGAGLRLHFFSRGAHVKHGLRRSTISHDDCASRSLTSFRSADSFIFGKEFVGENRGIDRILRRLKLHAEGRQFGDQNS
jgi:hypothetical protein